MPHTKYCGPAVGSAIAARAAALPGAKCSRTLPSWSGSKSGANGKPAGAAGGSFSYDWTANGWKQLLLPVRSNAGLPAERWPYSKPWRNWFHEPPTFAWLRLFNSPSNTRWLPEMSSVSSFGSWSAFAWMTRACGVPARNSLLLLVLLRSGGVVAFPCCPVGIEVPAEPLQADNAWTMEAVSGSVGSLCDAMADRAATIRNEAASITAAMPPTTRLRFKAGTTNRRRRVPPPDMLARTRTTLQLSRRSAARGARFGSGYRAPWCSDHDAGWASLQPESPKNSAAQRAGAWPARPPYPPDPCAPRRV
jgi:hypothetical protein